MAAILEDTAVPPLLDAALERVRSEPRKGRFPPVPSHSKADKRPLRGSLRTRRGCSPHPKTIKPKFTDGNGIKQLILVMLWLISNVICMANRFFTEY